MDSIDQFFEDEDFDKFLEEREKIRAEGKTIAVNNKTNYTQFKEKITPFFIEEYDEDFLTYLYSVYLERIYRNGFVCCLCWADDWCKGFIDIPNQFLTT